MNIGEPRKVIIVEEPAIPYKGEPVPERTPQKQPEPVPAGK